MIIPEGDLDVYYDDQGVYFHSDKVDLDKESLVFPAFKDGSHGTIEFFKRLVTWHPANGSSVSLTADQFVEMLKQ